MKRVVLNKKGFTLIELLVVISIIGILAGVVIGVVNPQRQKAIASDAVAQSTLSKFAEGLEAYNSSNGVYPTKEAFDEGNVSFIRVDNKPDELTYTVDTEEGIFYLCHVTAKDDTVYFVYDSSIAQIIECDSGSENCGAYGCE